jgi:hypothetical protein
MYPQPIRFSKVVRKKGFLRKEAHYTVLQALFVYPAAESTAENAQKIPLLPTRFAQNSVRPSEAKFHFQQAPRPADRERAPQAPIDPTS